VRLAACGSLGDDDLDAMLAEVDEERKALAGEMRRAEDAAETARRLEAARDSLACASSYDPVHAEWYEDPDAIQPYEFLTLGASPEEVRAAYRRHAARFEVDSHWRAHAEDGGGGGRPGVGSENYTLKKWRIITTSGHLGQFRR